MYRLNEAELLAEARRQGGLDDLHEAGLGDRLVRLLAHLDGGLGLEEVGKRAAFESVLGLVVARAGLLSDRQRYPAIADERIERPLFVTGLPRSGTTLMHALLAEHPANRAPLLWEVVRPSPPPGLAPEGDGRAALADAEV